MSHTTSVLLALTTALTLVGCGSSSSSGRGSTIAASSSASQGGIQSGVATTTSGGIAGAGSNSAGATGTVLGYVAHVKPILAASCVSCHSTLSTGYSLTAGLADDVADRGATVVQSNLQLADQSPLLLKATGSVSHGGGQAFVVGSTEYNTIVQWIQGGALLNAPAGQAAPPPPPATVPAQPTYVVHIKPIMQSCAACHVNQEPELSPGLVNDTADYTSLLQEADLSDPPQSGILEHPTQQDSHPVKLFETTSIQYRTILRWVQNGAPFS